MSCDRNSSRATRAAGPSGINQAGSKSGSTVNQTAQLSFFGRGGREAQVSFFERDQAAGEPQHVLSLPGQGQIKLSRYFTPVELDKLAVQLHLGETATTRHVRELTNRQTRGIGHSDPRPIDWAQSDQQQYRFLIGQLRRARRGNGYLDTSALKKNERVELWEFARFEADRAQRNIDHLTAGLSHLKGPTADYLVKGHQLEARFYGFLAEQLEQIIPAKALVQEDW